MNLSKAKVYLDKINRDFARMSKDPDTILRIDIDIMMSNVRELYDALLSDEELSAPAKAEPARPKVAPERPRETPEPPAPVAAAPDPGVPAYTAPSAPPQAEPAPPPEEKPAPAPPPPPVVVEPVRAAEPLPTIKMPPPPPTTQAATPPSFPTISPDAEALFEHKQVKELSEKLSELPIADLRKAISLNDKLLLIRELFGGDNQAFDNAIDTLNGFQRMDQAKAYLMEYCVMRYRWTEKKRAETAKNFIKFVRRRYN